MGPIERDASLSLHLKTETDRVLKTLRPLEYRTMDEFEELCNAKSEAFRIDLLIIIVM
jgi:hypothetical protein